MFIRGYVPVLLASTMLAGCSDTVTDLDPAGPCARPGIATDSWEVVDRSGFNFRLPPGFTDLEVQPIDSDVMVFELGEGDAFLSFDFGIYTGELTDFDCSVDIDGTEARLAIRETDDRMVVTARWRDLGPPLFSEAGPALLMTGDAQEPGLVDLLLAAIHSVVIE